MVGPAQVAVLTISEKFEDYASKVNQVLSVSGLRTELDISKEKVGYKIRQQTLQKIPYMIVIGANEVASGEVNMRARSGEQLSFSNIDTALAYLLEMCRPPDLLAPEQSLQASIDALELARHEQ